MPTPAAAIAVMLPVYLDNIWAPTGCKSPLMLKLVLLYTLFIAFMMVSTIPTYSGKLLGERVGREWVLPIFVLAIGFVAMLFTYPYETLAAVDAGLSGDDPGELAPVPGEGAGRRRHLVCLQRINRRRAALPMRELLVGTGAAAIVCRRAGAARQRAGVSPAARRSATLTINHGHLSTHENRTSGHSGRGADHAHHASR